MRAFKSFSQKIIHALVVVGVILNVFTPIKASASSEDTSISSDIQSEAENLDGIQKTILLNSSSKKLARGIKMISSSNPLEEKPFIDIQLKATPESLEPDGKVTIFWAIDGVSVKDLQGSALEFFLPTEFTPAQTEEGIFDKEKNSFTISVTKLKGRMQIIAISNPAIDAIISVSLTDKEKNLTANSTLIIPLWKHYKVQGKTREVIAQEGSLKVKFQQNTLDKYPEGVDLKIGTPANIKALQSSLSGNPFEIKAWKNKDGSELTEFSEGVEFKVNLADYGFTKENNENVYLYWYNPETNDWYGMLSKVDVNTNTLIATTTHFSIFDISADNWEASKKPSVGAFQVSNFTGAAAYSMPIEVPPGPGGLQPSLSLNYNSQNVDQATKDSQPGWVGVGWSLETGTIERNTHNTTNLLDDSWTLNVNGIATEIISTPDGGYYATNENFMKISYNGNDTWTIWDKAGNIYYFEYSISMRYGTHVVYDGMGSCPLITLPYRWSLTRVKNIFGKTITYSYAPKETKVIKYLSYACDLTLSTTSDTASYLSTITYPDGRTRVRFVLEARTDYNVAFVTDDIHHSFERQRLNQIIIERDTNGDGSFETVMKAYDLTYSTSSNNQIWPNIVFSAGGKMSTLVSVQEWGSAWSTAMPPVTFAYGDHMHLTSANNGQGGTVTFAYEIWHYDTNARPSYKSHLYRYDNPIIISTPGLQPNYRGENYFPLMPGRAYYMSSNLTPLPVTLCLYDGYNCQNTPRSTTPQGILVMPATASNQAKDLLNNDNPYDAYHNPREWTTYLRIGDLWALTTIYRVAAKTISDGNGNPYTYTYNYAGTAVNDPAHSASAANNSSYQEPYSEFRGHATVTETAPDGTQTITSYYQDDIYRGMAYNTQVIAGGKKLSETISTYSNASLPGHNYAGKIIPRYWTKLDAVENRIYNNDGTTYSATKTVYTYESTYGNMLSQTEQFWNNGVWAPYRKQINTYLPNNSATRYLVSLPAETKMLDAADAILANTIYLYDGNTGSHQTMPVNGVLTSIRTLSQKPTDFSQTSFAYDTWGNRTSQSSWTSYGTATSNPPGTSQASTTSFDTTYHVYPISITNALGQTTYIDYDYSKGVPKTEINPNGDTTYATYDAFGRIITLTRPLDSSPTITITYHNIFPFSTTLKQRIDDTSSYIVERIYDGMGRQTKIVSGGSVVDTIYESATVTKQSMPYIQGETDYYYTTTTINPATQTTTVSSPDGTTTTTTSNGLLTTVNDVNGNTLITKDVWGNVVNITPPTGPGVSYTYDTMGNMLTAARGGATTTTGYDQAGHKTSMSDPDMGDWGYAYDAIGNLTRQTDALGQRTCLYYDQLNRLTGKHYRTDDACPTNPALDVSYGYDLGTYGVGLRTSMTDDSGSTSWTYDVRGRMTSEIKTISGASYPTYWTYNSADLPVTMKYPDNEVVTYTYNARMLLDKVTSETNEYVSSSGYDSSGRMTSRQLGNGLTQSYSYYQWDEPAFNQSIGQGGRLKSMSVGTLQSLSYVYDAAGNIRSIANAIDGEVQFFGYDSLNRLVSAAVTNGPAPYAESYQYNSTTGNLLSKGGITLGYDDLDHVHAATSAGGNTYTYDANGNMVTRTVDGQNFSLVYDEENRLIGVSTQGSQASLYPASNSRTSGSFLAVPVQQAGETSTPTPTMTSGVVINIPVASANDDVEESASGWMYLDSTDLELIHDSDDQKVGLRFTGVDIPQGATILNAYVQFTVDETSSEATSLTVQAEASDNAPAFGTSTSNLSIRPRTTNSVSWNPPAWLTLNESGTDQRTPDITSVIQEVVNRAGWINGNAIAIVLTGTGKRVAFAYEGNTSKAARLIIEYTTSAIPTPSITTTPNITPTASVTATPTINGTPTASPTLITNTPTPTAAGQTFTLSLQPNAATGNDVYILASSSSNYGTASDLGVGEKNNATGSIGRSLIKFDLSSIPANATITSATLSLWTSQDLSDTDALINVYRLKTPFNETQATWNNAASGVSWQTAGASGANDRESTSIGSTSILANEPLDTEKQILFDPAKIQEMINGTFTNNGFIIVSSIELNDRFMYKSSDSGTSAQRPKLVVQYTVGGATSTATQIATTNTATNTPTRTPTQIGPTNTPTRTPTPINTATPTVTPSPTTPPVPVFSQASFTYDGDGRRVKSVLTTNLGTSTTIFVGNHYEVTDGVVTKYYFAGAQRIAMRTNGTLTYLLSDHLGSTSLTTDASGGLISQMKYKAWGEVRYSTGNTLTDYTYTGQYSHTADFGLMFYNARWYDPTLGRFAQADSILPDAVQGLDRYAYVNNSPMNFVDPSGHESVCGQANSDPECGDLGHSDLSHPHTSGGNGNSRENGNESTNRHVVASPQLTFPPNLVADPTHPERGRTGCIATGASGGYCSNYEIYFISRGTRSVAFSDFLMSLDNSSWSETAQNIGEYGFGELIDSKLEGATSFLDPIGIAYDIYQDTETGAIDIFGDSVSHTLQASGDSDINIIVQTYIMDNAVESNPYIYVQSGSETSTTYSGSYIFEILNYLDR